MFPANVAFSELSNVNATASALVLILVAVSNASENRHFLSALSVASNNNKWSAATPVTCDKLYIAVALKLAALFTVV